MNKKIQEFIKMSLNKLELNLKIKLKHKLLIDVIILIIINTIFWIGIIQQNGIIIQRDFNFPLYRENFLSYSTTIWNDLASQPNIEQLTRLLVRLPYIFLTYVGVDIAPILKLMIIITYLFISLSMFIFLNELFKYTDIKNKNIFLIIGSLIFAYNPASLQFSGGISLLFSFGVLPLLLYLILRYRNTEEKKFVIFFSIALLFSMSHPFILMMNILISFLFSIIFVFDNRNIDNRNINIDNRNININRNIDDSILKKMIDLIKSYLSIFVLFFLLAFWLIIPYLLNSSSSIDLGRPAYTTKYIFELVSSNDPYKILLLERNQFTYVNTFPHYITNKNFHIISLGSILILSLVVPIFYIKHSSKFFRNLTIFSIFGYIITTMLSLGAKFPMTGQLYWYIISSTPIGWMVRSPLKFQLYQSFFLIFLFIMSISILLKRYSNRYLSFAIFSIIILIFVGTSAYGIIDANYNSLNPITIPSQFYEINKILDKENKNYKVLWFPMYNELNTNWSKGHKIAAFDMKSSRYPTFNIVWNYNYLEKYIYDKPLKSKLKEYGYYKYFLSIGVKYIVFHNDMNYKIDNEILKNIANNSKNIYNNGSWYLFELKEVPAEIIDIRNNVSIKDDIYKYASQKDAIINFKDMGKIKDIENIENINSSIHVKNKDDDIKISYIKNGLEWIVNINASKPFLLSFSETYDPLWRADIYIENKKVNTVRSIPIYSVINGFWIGQTGNMKIIIRYESNTWFEIGSIVSILTFIGCMGYIIIKPTHTGRSEGL